MEKIIVKNYGSIPHLSTSKLTQQADKKIIQGQEDILTKKTRDWHDLVIVTEKIDGSNVGIYIQDGEPIPITRAGYHALSSQYEHHHLFAKWVDINKDLFKIFPSGYRVCGEWCAMAHGTIYDITNESPFVAFDIINSNNERLTYLDFVKLCSLSKIPMVPLLHIGSAISINNCIKLLGKGHYGLADTPEGFVMRVERLGKVDFLAKWVRDDKEDGKYMKDTIFNKGFIL